MYIFSPIYGSFGRIVNISCLVFIFAKYRPSLFHFNFRKKGEILEGTEVVVSLSLIHALSEIHPLSETSALLASKRNLRENLPRQHALSASPARPMRFLSLLVLSVPGSLSQNSLTRA